VVGFGAVAELHTRQLRAIGVDVLGVLEVCPERRRQARAERLRAIESLAQAAEPSPTFWDICVPTSMHFAVLSQILGAQPEAHVLIEKPVCQPSEVAALCALPSAVRSRITVNENYLTSRVTEAVRDWVAARHVRPRRVVVEMTKNRGADAARGRFIDAELGVLGYEGPHLLAILRQLGHPLMADRIESVELDEAGQGTVRVRGTSREHVAVELYSSMNGRIGHAYPPFSPVERIRDSDSTTRHRLVAIEGVDSEGRDCSVVGFYEPVGEMGRSDGAVALLRGTRVVAVHSPIQDDTMTCSLRSALEFFTGEGENPNDILKASADVELLHQLRERARSFRH
jgi:hypothetical protein